MTFNPFRVAVAVYGVLLKDDHVLLMRRSGSGYRDGQLTPPAGHLDGGEDAITALIRELREELAIETDAGSCRLAAVVHTAPEYATDHEYLHLFFFVERWSGNPAIAEPDLCSELLWVPVQNLPVDVIDYVAAALRTIGTGPALLVHGWSSAQHTADESSRLRRDWTQVDACTLPTIERPLRLAEFDDLFATSLRHIERDAGADPTKVRLVLVGGEELPDRVRQLADMESACCSFFTFEVSTLASGSRTRQVTVALDVRVPARYADVVAGLVTRAEAARHQQP
jgi:ADP-ribose pyrophosphatase YjhB (NUDIX family)